MQCDKCELKYTNIHSSDEQFNSIAHILGKDTQITYKCAKIIIETQFGNHVNIIIFSC